MSDAPALTSLQVTNAREIWENHVKLMPKNHINISYTRMFYELTTINKKTALVTRLCLKLRNSMNVSTTEA